VIIVALHGFFGAPDDWRSELANLKAASDHEIVVPDVGVWATRAEIIDFETFSSSFNRSVKALSERRKESVMIAGYSMGARLAAHCVLEDPTLYRAALLISMNPGLPQADLEARRLRFEADLQWAERMRRDPWESTWKSWNEQIVLRSGTRSVRNAVDHARRLEQSGRKVEGRREAWARAIEIWSLGHQADLRDDLLEWAAEDDHRLTLMTGTDDTKFTELTVKWLAEGLAKAGYSTDTVRHRLVLGAGHRLLVEAPDDVVSEISTLLAY
jgi:2-succinyl-6-hydroxy-2,4-cyclohexadiene-1-carboxylate synthase